jgi:hypothetical protein
MSSIASKWPVLVSLPVTADDRDEAGALTVAAAERCFASARGVYLEGCRTLADGVDAAAEVRDVVVRPRDELDAALSEVTVSVSVIEVFADRFTMNVRIRPAEGDAIAAEGSCDVLPPGGVGRELRDELIAKAHAAAHYH